MNKTEQEGKEEQMEVENKINFAAIEYAEGMMGIGEFKDSWNYGDKVMYNNLRRSYIQGAVFGRTLSTPPNQLSGIEVEEFEKMFDNNSDCYTCRFENDGSMTDDIPAMTKKKFIQLIAGYAASEGEERKFSLKEALEIYERHENPCDCLKCQKIKREYFKDKFNIDI